MEGFKGKFVNENKRKKIAKIFEIKKRVKKIKQRVKEGKRNGPEREISKSDENYRKWKEPNEIKS